MPISCTIDEAMTNGTCTSCPFGEVQDPDDKTQCKNCDTDEAEKTPGKCTKCPVGQIQDTDKTKCSGKVVTIHDIYMYTIIKNQFES